MLRMPGRHDGVVAHVRERSWFGWGFVDEALPPEAVDGLGAVAAARFGVTPTRTAPPVLSEVGLAAPRVAPPSTLAAVVVDDLHARAAQTYGKAYRDVARAFERACSTGRPAATWPSSPTAGCPAWSAAWRPTSPRSG